MGRSGLAPTDFSAGVPADWCMALGYCCQASFGRKRSTALASLLHIPIRLRAKSLEQRPTLGTTERRDLRECIRDHATARSDHHATLALPRPIAQRIDDAADRLREAFREHCVRTGRSDRPT